MAKLSPADMIWNRACGNDRARSFPGDRALADLLRAHGLVMNGGVLHSMECLTATELSDAQSAYRFFGLDAVADLLLRGRTILEAGNNLDFHEHQLDAQYAAIIPDDTTLVDRFQKHLQLNPAEYAPL